MLLLGIKRNQVKMPRVQVNLFESGFRGFVLYYMSTTISYKKSNQVNSLRMQSRA